MHAPTIRLATDQDFARISSQNSVEILDLPFLYIPTEDSDVMRSWGVANGLRANIECSVREIERLFPGTLVAPKYLGEHMSRGELLYNGAEPAADFLPLLEPR